MVDFSEDLFRKAIERKYSFTEKEVNHIIDNTIFKTTEDMKNINKIQSKAVLITDGFYPNRANNDLFLTKNLTCFPCRSKYLNLIKLPNLTILQDNRIYPELSNTKHYIKKILLGKIKKPTKQSNKLLLYTTTNCRKFDVSKYPKEDVVCLTNDEKIDGYTYLEMPVENIFNEFKTYVYTPVSTKFDCSPRFIVECKYFNKEVIYDINYFDDGLKYRREDIENDLESLTLKENDFIVGYMKKIFNEA